MITNERQYRISKAALQKFESALLQLQNEPAEPEKEVHPLLQKAYLDSAQSEIELLRAQIKGYEDLRDGRARASYHDLTALDKLPHRLIEIRIASGLTQKDLAAVLGIKEQQIQRYEASGYAGASLSRVREVATALRHHKKRVRSSKSSPPGTAALRTPKRRKAAAA